MLFDASSICLITWFRQDAFQVSAIFLSGGIGAKTILSQFNIRRLGLAVIGKGDDRNASSGIEGAEDLYILGFHKVNKVV